MNISLTKELEKLVEEKVKSGLYQTASEVVRDGLRLLEERDRLYRVRLEELRGEIRKGLESGEAKEFDAAGLRARVKREVARTRRHKRR
jgi:antitoxin ParD1/3/4